MIDWHQFHRDETQPPVVVDPRRRLQISLVCFLLLLAVVFGRAVQLEISQGAAFRAEAEQPVQRQISLPGARGRILARDGTVLVEDEDVARLAVSYRSIEEPPDPRWLRQMAGKRLSKVERRDPARLAEEESRLRRERSELQHRLAALCGLSPDQWEARAREIQASAGRGASEPLGKHVMVENLAPDAVAEVEAHPERYPGAKILHRTRRRYPTGAMAAHVLGYLGPPDAPLAASHDSDPVGRAGVERQYETSLRGHRGVAVELADHAGRRLAIYRPQEPLPGRDLVLTLDPSLQRAAEELLDSALARRDLQAERPEPAGGAIVVMDVHSGEILAAACAPRFEPALFAGGDPVRRAALLSDPAHPLFDRVVQMALPPGSVFKTLTAVALLETGTVDPRSTFTCQGYLKQPDQRRCALFVRHGVGHGEVTLTDALAQSCNVYFFHYAASLGAAALVDWSERLGLGHPTGVDLPGEAAGTLPQHPGDTLAMAIGQDALTATPLQVVRMMAAVANGGRLVTPHVAKDAILPDALPIAGLHPSTLAAVREGLEHVVADPKGTAHGSVYLDSIAIAGKTGTASVGPRHADHAWFAGYVPADKPRWAMVVVLEHAGDAAIAAGPVVKRLVLRMPELSE